MTFFLILLAVATALLLALLRLIESGDRGHRAPPSSHPIDQSFYPPVSHL